MEEACSGNPIGGFNDILSITLEGVASSPEGRGNRRIIGMEKPTSRIPKLTFGFRRSTKTNGTVSEGNTPRGGTNLDPPRSITPSGVKSAPGSNNTSPNLSRSKSLRVPRSTTLKSRSNASLLEPSREQDESGFNSSPSGQNSSVDSLDSSPAPSRGEVEVEQKSFLRPRSKTIGSGMRRRMNRNSRSLSPTAAEEAITAGTTESRTKSFGLKKTLNGSTPMSGHAPSPSTTHRANSIYRSKTPTSLAKSRHAQHQDAAQGNRAGGTATHQGLTRTGSGGRLARYSTQPISEEKVILRKSTRRESTGGRIPRPSSMCASEDAGVSLATPSAASMSSRSSGRGTSLASSKRSHSSIGYNNDGGVRSPSPTAGGLSSHSSSLLSSQGSNGKGVTSKPSKYLSTRSRSSSIETPSGRPSSATAFYHGRRSSGPKDIKQGSTPSSGRSTPVHRMSLGNGGKEGTDGGTVSTTRTGLPPRTPYRVARTKAVPSSELAGMNELEGSVLLEADDYRKLFNEVKALKTALLKMKRELQEDSGATPAQQTPAGPRPVGRSRTSPSAGQISHADYTKKLKAIGQEKEAMSEELDKLRKDNKAKSARIESLTKELSKAREEQKSLTKEKEEVTEHRDRLLDKVERLHADKHKLEARLNTLERASIYEQTWSESWLDEVDGEESFGDSLDMDPSSSNLVGSGGKGGVGREKKGTESDVAESLNSDGGEGESSEPESMAVCSVPVI